MKASTQRKIRCSACGSILDERGCVVSRGRLPSSFDRNFVKFAKNNKSQILSRIFKNRVVSLKTKCWMRTNGDDQGRVSVGGRPTSVFRIMAILHGVISGCGPEKIYHKCGHKACFNPKHLYAGVFSGCNIEKADTSKAKARRLLTGRTRKDGASGCWGWTGVLAPNGYGRVRWGGRKVLVHRLSAFAFNGAPLDSKVCVLHKCDNPSCCNPKHLFLGTRADNGRDMVFKGRSVRGQDVWNAKLSEEDVRQIRTKASAGEPIYSLAKKYGVCWETISCVLKGKSWKWVQ